MWELKAPSLIRGSCAEINKINIPITTTKDHHHPKHVVHIGLAKSENKGQVKHETKPFLRSPGRWSFKGINPKSKQNANKEDKSEKLNDDKKGEAKPQNIKSVFQRSWSLRGQNKNTGQDKLACQRNKRTRKDKYFLPLEKCSSQNDLTVGQQNKTFSRHGKMTQAVSTSSIPSEVGSVHHISNHIDN